MELDIIWIKLHTKLLNYLLLLLVFILDPEFHIIGMSMFSRPDCEMTCILSGC